MKTFMDENFLLHTKTAQRLYHDHAAKMPIIDYHCHLPPDEIAIDKQFENLTRIWLNGDHYKWRAMRTNGIDERYITGDASDEEKFMKWAETVPYTMRNPLYHWTHLELRNPFGIKDILNPKSAKSIYERCNEMLNSPEFSTRNLLRKMNVELLCTTDDPVDDLSHHQAITESNFKIKILPTFRPDKAMAVDNPETYNAYLDRLGQLSDVEINTFPDLMAALTRRHDFFHQQGCRLSDHGLETIVAADYSKRDIDLIFNKIRSGKTLTQHERDQFQSEMLYQFALLDHSKGWTQQFHIGALRNNNSRLFKELGPDTGFDSIGDFEVAKPMSRLFDRLDSSKQLAKTIVYNLNPRDNELLATMIGNFNDGSVAGKIQYGSGWWFLDQKDGMIRQMNALSNLGLLSRFVGMLTDSRSFLSYPRHEYFRRILCALIGDDVENGELPADMDWLGQMVENISYTNARQFFGFDD